MLQPIKGSVRWTGTQKKEEPPLPPIVHLVDGYKRLSQAIVIQAIDQAGKGDIDSLFFLVEEATAPNWLEWADIPTSKVWSWICKDFNHSRRGRRRMAA